MVMSLPGDFKMSNLFECFKRASGHLESFHKEWLLISRYYQFDKFLIFGWIQIPERLSDRIIYVIAIDRQQIPAKAINEHEKC